jgi:hypothetical protein
MWCCCHDLTSGNFDYVAIINDAVLIDEKSHVMSRATSPQFCDGLG